MNFFITMNYNAQGIVQLTIFIKPNQNAQVNMNGLPEKIETLISPRSD